MLRQKPPTVNKIHINASQYRYILRTTIPISKQFCEPHCIKFYTNSRTDIFKICVILVKKKKKSFILISNKISVFARQDFLPTRPRSRSYGGGEDPSSTTSWRHWPDTGVGGGGGGGGGSGYLGGALRETAIGSSAAIYDHNGHRRTTTTTADQKR